ncbi:DNA polymerase III subunit delta' [Acetobacter lambici]|uniref:DNA polymerase III subunit delta n=1 Tax=Acetobacter lambici TaxID=1332824 RepID=A0ABT1EVU9_9PROT|nr:DNA polymerase III subunit delta' [Acetobacter lambici]MCP1241247.1 DNA polymerase III subunit delta' [Acetobacter lambici]MCP1257082.1 DNA polymerase III subunit delta' [Acetobacter lambici]NHO55575.1 DNA polymerase III subunit delta' [Acetobacter lambici]
MSDALSLSPRMASLQLHGHGAELALFVEALAKGRMPHAWLVIGPPGIGKATFAFALARILLGGEAEEHPVGRRISAATHADLLVVERGYDEKKQRYRQEIVADDVRPINAFLRRTAAEGGWRVVIVDGAEWMNRSAANAVLKILEEPPPATVLVLTSSAPGRLLPTIRSRCRRLELAPLPEADMRRVLHTLWPDLPEQDFLRILSQSHGAPGKAVALLADSGGGVAALVAEVLQGVPALRGYEIAETVLRKDYDFGLFFALLADQLQSTARQAAKAGSSQCIALAAAWEQIMRVHTETERFNLDKQEALIEAMTIASPE